MGSMWFNATNGDNQDKPVFLANFLYYFTSSFAPRSIYVLSGFVIRDRQKDFFNLSLKGGLDD